MKSSPPSSSTTRCRCRAASPNQPNPRAEPHRKICGQFWKFAMLALLAQLLWVFLLGGRTVLDQRLFFATDNEEPVTTQSFRSSARRAAWCCATTPTSTTTGSASA
jgi:hypothetical protein